MLSWLRGVLEHPKHPAVSAPVDVPCHAFSVLSIYSLVIAAIQLLLNLCCFPSKILAEDVNFFNFPSTESLMTACKQFIYPPRFVLRVSARNAKQYSNIELTFTGAEEDLYFKIWLYPLEGEFSH